MKTGDKDKKALNSLSKAAEKYGRKNIKIIKRCPCTIDLFSTLGLHPNEVKITSELCVGLLI